MRIVRIYSARRYEGKAVHCHAAQSQSLSNAASQWTPVPIASQHGLYYGRSWGYMKHSDKADFAGPGQKHSHPLSADVLRLRSEELFAQSKQVVIEHAGREYCLRLTAGNKLILTA